jgi:hypothetical protein
MHEVFGGVAGVLLGRCIEERAVKGGNSKEGNGKAGCMP